MSLHHNLPPIEDSSRSEKVYELLKEQIIQRKLLPGDKLDIYALAGALKVSRTPIKEAFNRLSSEGLITIVPQRGTYVRKLISAKEIQELFDVRLMIESWGLQACLNGQVLLNFDKMEDNLRHCDSLFASPDNFDYMTFYRCDNQFHSLIVDAANNSRLSKMYDSLAVHILNLRAYWGQPLDRVLRAKEDHHKIFEGLRQKSSAVRGMLVNHIERSKRITLALVASEPRSGKDLPTESPSPVTRFRESRT